MFANKLEKEPHKCSIEESLLKRIANDDLSAFWELWLQHKDYLYYQCLRWLGNHVEAQEVLSCAMLRAWEKLPQYVLSITNVRAWLTRLTHNLCIDFYRGQQKAPYSTDNLEAINGVDRCSAISDGDTPEDSLMRHELSVVLAQLISDLPPHLQTPVVLRFCKHQSYETVADALSISEVAVRKRIQKARFLLRQKLDSYLSGDTYFEFSSEERKGITPMLEEFDLQSLQENASTKSSFKLEIDSTLYQLSSLKLEATSTHYRPLSCSMVWC